MAQHDMDSAELESAAKESKKQPAEHFTVPVTFIDLYWANQNEKFKEEHPDLVDGDDGLAQTEFNGELFFNDEVYEFICEDCGHEHKNGYLDKDSGVSYCFKCVAEMMSKGLAKLVKA